MTRSDLARWQAQVLHIVVGVVKRKYQIDLLDDIAPLDEATLLAGFKDAIDDATYKLWKALEQDGRAIGDKWGQKADEAYELWREAVGP